MTFVCLSFINGCDCNARERNMWYRVLRVSWGILPESSRLNLVYDTIRSVRVSVNRRTFRADPDDNWQNGDTLCFVTTGLRENIRRYSKLWFTLLWGLGYILLIFLSVLLKVRKVGVEHNNKKTYWIVSLAFRIQTYGTCVQISDVIVVVSTTLFPAELTQM